MTYSAEVLADTPLGYWRMGEASGTTMVDSSGNGRNGTYAASGITLGATGLLVGDADTAATYNGSADSGIADAAWMDVTQATIEAWFKTTDTGENYIAGRWTGLAANNHMFIDLQSSNGIRVYATIAGSTRTASATVTGLRDGNPHHVVATYNGTDLLLYVDKVLKATVTISGSLITTAAQDFRIGVRTVVNTSAFNGTLDEIAFYDHALSSTRVAAHYDVGTGALSTVTGTLAGTLQRKTAAITAFAQASATLAGDLQRKTGAFTTWANADATLAGTLQRKTAAVTLDAGPVLSLAGDLQRKTAAFTLDAADAIAEVALAGELQRKTAAVSLDAAAMVSLAGDLQRKTATVELLLASEVTLAGDLQRKTAALEVSTLERPVSLAGTLRRKIASITLKVPPYISLAGTLRPKTASITLNNPPQTDTHNTVGGLVIDGYGVSTWTPDIVTPPVALSIDASDAHETAVAFSTPTLVDGRPIYDITEVKVKRHRDRILVGGRDITYERGIQTPVPSYMLTEPLDYGAGKLTLPQIHAAFERPGIGALKWCAKGKPVVVQRVDVDTNDVVATDYRGFITEYDINGSDLVCSLGGAVSGRMALKWRPIPVFKITTDAGRLAADRVRANTMANFTPLLGPVTGIRMRTFGGMNELDWFHELMAKAVLLNGSQYTVTRNAAGNWHMPLKDRTTVDFTIYLDGNRMPAELHQALSEEPNRIYATGITKEGVRIDFIVYPGLIQGEAAPYPYDDNSPFSAGTADLDTDSGDGVTVMVNRLIQMGYVDRDDAADYVYDADVTAGIKVLQNEAELTQSGAMNPATWRALYDLDATGYSLSGAVTLPAAQRTAVRKWLRSASGALMRRNPNYDPHKVVVDHILDMGPGFTAHQIREWARDEIGEEGHWSGTATCNLAVIRGEHNPGDPLDPADIMPAREIRPGMNGWAPLFGGTAANPGTLFHVSGVSVPAGGRAPQLILDTKARDTMQAWQVILRNRESRRNPARIWFNLNLSSRVQKDALGPWNRLGGRIDKMVAAGGRWTVFPCVAGQAGIVRSIRIRTVNPETRFCVAVFGKKVNARRLDHINPNPLTEAGTAKWDQQWVRNWFENRWGLYVAGGFKERGGYWPGQETDDNTGDPTGDPITGKHYADAGFSYYVDKVLWVAIWVEDDTTLPAGRIMWNQLESGA